MAFKKLFVNTVTLENKGAPKESLMRLHEVLGKAVFAPELVHDVIEGKLDVDVVASKFAFEKFGYKDDGGNGARVLSLAKHLANGGAPNEWVDDV
jgi:hypothetical protein